MEYRNLSHLFMGAWVHFAMTVGWETVACLVTAYDHPTVPVLFGQSELLCACGRYRVFRL